MRMSKKTFGELADAIDAVMEKYSLKKITEHRQNVKFVKNQFMAFCWSMFRISNFNIMVLYADGLNDNHIETALKHILSDFE